MLKKKKKRFMAPGLDAEVPCKDGEIRAIIDV